MMRLSLLISVLLPAVIDGKLISVRSSRDLTYAIQSVKPGDTIYLQPDTTYHLSVDLKRSGHPMSPITFAGDKGTKIIGDGTAIHLHGSFWRIQKLDFANVREGIIVTGHNNTLKGLAFHDIEEEAIVLKGNGNVVRNSVFNGANHGIMIHGVENQLLKNSITCLTTTVTASPKSCCGLIQDNTFSGLVSVLGGDFDIIRNTANSDVAIGGKRNNLRRNVINGRLDVSGCGNIFFGNTAGLSHFSAMCYNWDDGKNNFGINGNDEDDRHKNFQPTYKNAVE